MTSAQPPHEAGSNADRSALRRAWTAERQAARAAQQARDLRLEWTHLERAHVLSQPLAGRHLRTHAAMLTYGIRGHDRRDILGQLLRLAVAAPARGLAHRLGNTGGANVSALQPMPLPDDLRAVLQGAGPAGLTETEPTTSRRNP